MVGSAIDQPGDGLFSYYRSKALWFSVGLSVREYVRSAKQTSDSYSAGRNVSVLPYRKCGNDVTIAPAFGAVGSQFEPALGWARAIKLQSEDSSALAFAIAGDGAVSTGGFWSSIREASAASLPLVTVIENNGMALSTPASIQMRSVAIADQLCSLELDTYSFDGTNPESIQKVRLAVEKVRDTRTPALIELAVPRLDGHSAADGQLYCRDDEDTAVKSDPVDGFADWLIDSGGMTRDDLAAFENEITKTVDRLFNETGGGPPRTWPHFPEIESNADVQVDRPFTLSHDFGQNNVSIGHAINCWLRNLLEQIPGALLLGQDIGRMGGVHGVTMGLQRQFGPQRVIDACLNESAIVGQAFGMALRGLRPIVEIQYRKYVAPATEQLQNLSLCSWLTGGEFVAPVILRIPFGQDTVTDPWHSESDEATLIRTLGCQIACPSSSQDAIDLLDTAFASEVPTIFLEHQSLYYAAGARTPIRHSSSVRDAFSASVLKEGRDLTIVTWGQMARTCLEVASDLLDVDSELIDLRWLKPWDSTTVLESVRKTGRCLVVHEDRQFLGFGAEIAATVSEKCFTDLFCPVRRIGATESLVPVSPTLVDAVIPTSQRIQDTIRKMLTDRGRYQSQANVDHGS